MKKKLLFFLLTMVGVFLCAPPAMATPNNLYIYTKVQDEAESFNQTFTKNNNTFTYTLSISDADKGVNFLIYNTYNQGNNIGQIQYDYDNSVYWSSEFDSNTTLTYAKEYQLYRYTQFDKGSTFWFKPGEAGTFTIKVEFSNGGNDPKIIITKVQTKVAKPTFSPASGTVDSGTAITISCTTSGATIYYTLDGSDPKTSSTKKTYSSTSKPAITSANKRLRAYAAKSGMTDSDIADVTYNVNTPYDFSDNTKPASLQVIKNNKNPNFNSFSLAYNTTTKQWTGSFTATASGYVSFTISDGTTSWGPNKGSVTLGQWVNNAKGDVNSSDPYYQGGVTKDKKYTFTLKANDSDHSNFDWKIEEVPEKVWTVKADISRLVAGGNTLWSTSNIMCKFMKDDTALNGNDGAKGTASGNVVTFTLSSDTEPNKIIFHNGNWDKSNQTGYLSFVNNKTYVLNWGGYDLNVIEDLNTPISNVNLPYGPNDFKEPKYFLVGSRMGAWHLQPEWELLKQSDNKFVLRNGRFLYQGDFAVARVSNYSDYAHHYYDVLANAKKGVNLNTTSISGIKKVRRCENAKDNPYINDLMYIQFFSTYLGNNPGKIDIMKEDKGTYVDAVTLTKNADNDYTLDLTIADASNNTNRVFTLVGSDIVNVALAGDYKTYRGGKVSDGWQESWIQYDAAGRPYIDANGNYLYHTAFNSNWLSRSRVRFNIKDNKDRNFAYSSANITFMHYTLLPDLDTDPYREFYKHFGKDAAKTVSKDMEIKGGKAEDGTDYSFKAGIDTESITSDDWQCFVVRNVWVKGEFKIWTGWGGNSIKTDTQNDESNDARWNRVNGGPAGTAAKVAAMADINAGTAQTMNSLHIDQGPGSNFKTTNNDINDKGELTFYNRIVLWYNNGANGGIDKSFVMFIQEKSAPAIKAFLKGNDMNMPYYEWNLLNAAASGEQVTGYTVTRYRVTEGGNTNPNVIETVTYYTPKDASSLGELNYEETAALNPGTYLYNIKVTFKDGDKTIRREANSNRITVYGDNIAPDVRVEQLVILNQAGFDKLGVTELFKTRLKQDVEYKKDQFYLTYRGNLPTADYYVIRYAHPQDYTEADYNNENIVPAIAKQPQIIQIKPDVAKGILDDPTLYVWAGRFYVRALDYSAFKHNYDQIGTHYSTPVITLTDEEAVAEGGTEKAFGGENIATQLVNVKSLVGYDKEYIGTIVGRKGLLKAGRMKADMAYSYGETLNPETELYEHEVGPLTHSVPFTPVIAPPYNLKQMYEYRTIPVGNALAAKVDDKDKASDYKAYYKVGIIPTNNVAYSDKDPETGAIAVLAPESDIPNERHLDMVIEFTRPNISKRIYELYDIYYTINVKGIITDEATDQAKLNYEVGSIDNGVYYDPNENSTYDGENSGDYAAPNPYHITIRDIHPSGAIYPYFEIVKTEYRRKNLINDGKEFKTLEALPGADLHTSKPKVASTATSITGLGLGVNPAQEEDGVGTDGARWFLCSHKEVKTEVDYGTDINYIDNFDATKLFLVEITDGTNAAYGKTLWTHDHESSKLDESTGHYVQNRPFFIAALKKGSTTPNVVITPVYIFFHKPNFTYQSKANFRYLLPEGVEPPATPSQAVRRVTGADAETANPEFAFVEGNINNVTDAAGKVLYTVYDATKDSQITVARGAVATVESANAPVMTGIEDVTGEGADGEAVYYNLQGIRVAHPVRGQVYIRCHAGKNETIVF